MSQKMKPAGPPRSQAERLINGDPVDEERLIGGDTGLAAVMARARLVSRSGAPVLLFGETGTGKEIIARAVHEHSPFRHGPFRRVNCGAIAPELIDSELFGHEQGAFTGAVNRRKGWFEQADGARCFDGSASCRRAQVRLLRGSGRRSHPRRRRRPVHVKVTSSPPRRDIPTMVEAQTFHGPLTGCPASIVIPPLRIAPATFARSPVFCRARHNRSGCARLRCPTRTSGRGLSMARQRPRDGGGDGPRRSHRPGTLAERRRRTGQGTLRCAAAARAVESHHQPSSSRSTS